MLGKEDLTSYSHVLKLPTDSSIQATMDQIGSITLNDIRTEYLGRAGSLLKALAEGLPWLTFSTKWVQLSMTKREIRFNIQFKPLSGLISILGGEVEEDEDEAPQKSEHLFKWADLGKAEKDVNYLVGLVLGKLGVDPKGLRIEEILVLEKEKIFAKGFSEHFNQVFLASAGIKDVPRISILVESDWMKKKEEVLYSLTKGDKKDIVTVLARRVGFTSISLANIIETRISKANGILAKVGV